MHRYLTIYQLIVIQEYNNKFKYSIRKIAKEINSNKSTIQRILVLLSKDLTLLQIFEKQQTNKHKSGRKNILLNCEQVNAINEMLFFKKYAPDIITNELRKNNSSTISTKTLYNMFKHKQHGFDEKYLLRKGKNKPHKTKETRGKLSNSKSIHERDKLIPDIKNTLDFGHFEGDTIVGKDHKSSIITLADIKSKLTIPLVTENHKSTSVAQSIINFIIKLPQGTIKTITFDCGKEFSKWKLIEKICGIKIYFADPGTPNQRGLNENNNGILRRLLPKSTDLSIYTQTQLDEIALIINSTPRKILNYKKSLDLTPIF